jgi:hypothetical protein
MVCCCESGGVSKTDTRITMLYLRFLRPYAYNSKSKKFNMAMTWCGAPRVPEFQKLMSRYPMLLCALLVYTTSYAS